MKNNNKPSILLIKPFLKNDFRYLFGLTDELAKHFNLTCLFNYNISNIKPIKEYDIIFFNKNEYRKTKLNNLLSLFWFSIKTIKYIYKNNFDIYYVHGNMFSFLYPIFCYKKIFVYQTFTTSVSSTKSRRKRDNFLKKINLKFYKNIIVQNKKVAEEFNIPDYKIYAINGLWGFSQCLKNNSSEIRDELKLVYVGTFNNRRIYETIEGVGKFMIRNPSVNVRYILMGYGSEKELDNIFSTINKMKLEKQVKFIGFGDEYNIKKYFSECNVGVSYVPIVEYYNNVLVTKTYEYILSGLPVIATQTNENKKIVNDTNGVLINDTPDEFCKGLELLYKRKKEYNSQKIKSTLSDFTYENKVKNEYVPIFMRILGREI